MTRWTFLRGLLALLLCGVAGVAVAAARPLDNNNGPVNTNNGAGTRGNVTLMVVVETRGMGVDGAQVTVTTPDGKTVQGGSGMTDSKGIFKVTLRKGKYTFQATSKGMTATKTVVVTAATKSVMVMLK